jgi:hypothetical protein
VVVIALVVTPQGFPIAYEVLTGNTSDRTTLRGNSKVRGKNTQRAEQAMSELMFGKDVELRPHAIDRYCQTSRKR